MALDVRRQCAMCAWRGACNKKHTMKETLLHCPDFCRDRTLPEELAAEGVGERHKQVEDVFGSRKS